jgi:group I intron endonuclease
MVDILMFGIIYKITNKINGKYYIGQTYRTLEERWKEHQGDKRYCKYLYRAIKKYGKDNFEVKTIVLCNSMEELNAREQFCIRIFKSLAPTGYNLDNGGKNKKVHEETKKKMSESKLGPKNSNFGKKFSKEHLRKLSLARKGIKRSDEFKLKRSSIMIETWKNTPEIFNTGKQKEILKDCNIKRRMPIFCHQTGIVYESINFAARELKQADANIRSVLKGKYKQINGYTFSYVEIEDVV